ncbi:hypothetical protein FE697_009760 [Mumia zhuanghuii]|uniref:Integral membrane protein n=2 Tax=Mumia TaxID=1546255 RepID=A0ABW1QTT6_9ACTN|nr:MULTISPECIES: hypothetical protein [Mumia]KAA1423837.1 hypothetical protein FE697_009760 [Mumia zhuanghuii]
MGHTTPSPTPRIRLAALLVALEGVGIAAFGVLDLLDIHRDRVVLALATSLFFFAYATLLLATARGLWRLQVWVRAPIAFTQLIQLGIAWSLRDAAPLVSAVLAVTAAVVMFGTLSPGTSALLREVDEQAHDSQP